MAHMRLLGGAILEDEPGVVHPLASRRHPLALLALLATAPSHRLSRDTLLALLWPESPEGKARSRLNTCVHQIRSALGREVLESIGDDLRLDPDVIRCDVCEFEEALSREDRVTAIALYQGPFLDGFHLGGAPGFMDRIDRERDRLQRSYDRAVETLAEEAEERGEPEVAAEWWRERWNEDPYDSRVALRLMEALDAAGNRAAALRIADEHRRLLHDELDADPSAELREFAAGLREKRWEPDPSATGGSDDGSDAGSSVPAGPVRPVGRFGRRTPFAGIALLGLVAVAVAGDRPGRNGAAHELYQRARHLDRNPLVGSWVTDSKIELYRRALEIDPSYAEAWGGLADAYLERAWGGRSASWADSAVAASRRALEIDPTLADAHAQLGDVAFTSGRTEEALSAYRRALDLEPGNMEAMNNMVALLYQSGRIAEAMEWADRVHRRFPLSPWPLRVLVHLNLALGRDEVAEAWLQRHVKRSGKGVEERIARNLAFDAALFGHGDPDRAGEVLRAIQKGDVGLDVIRRRAALALYEGRWKEARRHYRALYPGVNKGKSPFQGLLWSPLGLAYAMDRMGEDEEAEEIVREVTRDSRSRIEAERSQGDLLHRLAGARLLAGDVDGAIGLLERSFDGGYRDARFLRTVPVLEALRDDPRFQALLDRMEGERAEERRRVEAEGWGVPEE
ncbi:MAG: tetratricopeptide repeat protein [Gemmatimonadota bacterium]|nr:tetratricopeptide repeat protein [Gemmatimonadota bacterium]